jgi:hypothetical protein
LTGGVGATPDDEDWNQRLLGDPLSNAADHEAREAAVSVRGHDDNAGAPFISNVKNGWGDITMPDFDQSFKAASFNLSPEATEVLFRRGVKLSGKIFRNVR